MGLLSHVQIACVWPSWSTDIHANICAQGTNDIRWFPIGVTGQEPKSSLSLLLLLLCNRITILNQFAVNLFPGCKRPEEEWGLYMEKDLHWD